MSDVVDRIFGGTDDSAQRAQQGANAATQAFIERQAAQARGDVMSLFPLANQQSAQGYQAALAAILGATPEQLRLAESGTMRAQQQLNTGAQQYQNAILGLPVDYSQFQQPQSLNAQTAFLNQPMPFLTNPRAATSGALQPPVTQQFTRGGSPVPATPALAGMASGGGANYARIAEMLGGQMIDQMPGDTFNWSRSVR